MIQEVKLSKENRIETIDLPSGIKKIQLEVSREKCNDVLLELIDEQGKAKGKPLHKFLPEIKVKTPLAKLRFIMNNFSTKPIVVEMTYF